MKTFVLESTPNQCLFFVNFCCIEDMNLSNYIHVLRRNTRVVQLKQWLHKRLLWGVRVMQRHNENEVKREVILWWRYGFFCIYPPNISNTCSMQRNP